jgi:hypothetical protein
MVPKLSVVLGWLPWKPSISRNQFVTRGLGRGGAISKLKQRPWGASSVVDKAVTGHKGQLLLARNNLKPFLNRSVLDALIDKITADWSSKETTGSLKIQRSPP